MEDLRSWLILLNVPGIGPSRLRMLVERFGAPGAALRAPIRELMSVPGVSEKTAATIRNYRDDREIARQVAVIERVGARAISWLDPEYPERLREIHHFPPVLFLRGTLAPADARALSIVGSRAATPYGRMMAERLARDLSARGMTIVSGMARGIDSLAHRAALSGGGRTLAVLGCGVDVVYPPENAELQKAIVQNGAVISEFPMGTQPEGPNFPRRNRIISGLSLGVVVVEAGEGSGALLTAEYARDQNREVFAVPGNVNVPKSRGTNELIKQGAKLVGTVEDVLEELTGVLGESPRPGAPPPISDDLPPDERSVLEVLSETPKHIDTICAEAGFPPSRTLSALLSLELSGLVQQRSGKVFVRA